MIPRNISFVLPASRSESPRCCGNRGLSSPARRFSLLRNIALGKVHANDGSAGNAPTLDHDRAAANLNAPVQRLPGLPQGRFESSIGRIGTDESCHLFPGFEFLVELLADDPFVHELLVVLGAEAGRAAVIALAGDLEKHVGFLV